MKCPGQDSRFWGPEAIFEAKCPECGGTVEFFRDESTRKCRKCGHKLVNPRMDFGCAAYCKFAEQCLGGELTPELLAKRSDLLKDRVAAEVKKSLGRDFRRIAHAAKVVDYAGKILRAESVEPAAATLAAYLLALGVPGTYGTDESCAAVVRLASQLLDRVGAPAEMAREAVEIVEGVRGGRNLDSPAFRCVSDADRIAELEEVQARGAGRLDAMLRPLGETLLTEAGRELAREVLAPS